MAVRRAALVACGAPLAARMPAIAVAIAAAGWSVTPIATRDALLWIDASAIESAADAPVRTEQRIPGIGIRSAPPDVVVICPATFNTINKLAAGTADTYALSSLCEWLGAGVPMLIMPMVNDRLWNHPAWQTSLTVLGAAGVIMLDIYSGESSSRPVISGTGDSVVERFDPTWITNAISGFA